MSKMKKYGKNQGKVYRSVFLFFFVLVLIIGAIGFCAFKFIKPRYEAYKIEKEQEKQEEAARVKQEEQEKTAKQEKTMRVAMEGGTVWNGHTYKVFDDGMTWDEAEAYCESLNGHLIIIESREEQTVAESLLGEKNFYWLGASVDLSNESSDWRWVNGESMEYSNWHGTQPDNFTGNESCLMMYNYPNPLDQSTGKGVWNDTQNDGECKEEEFFGAKNSGFICEWDRDI